MGKGISGKRYAQAVFQIALEEKQLDKWLSDVDKIAAVFSDAEIATGLSSPKISTDNKRELLGRGLKGISPVAMNLALLLVERGRVQVARGLALEYRRMMHSYLGMELAEVTTAVPITAQEGEVVGKGLAAMTGKRVTVETSVDPAILGGFVARMGDKLIDGSARTRLQELRRSMA